MARAEKLDLYKRHAAEYVAPKSPELVRTKPARYLAITGKGAPGGEAFQAGLGALYAAGFTIKMARKAAGRDYAVCKLEGLWWGERKGGDFSRLPPSRWNWTLLIRVPPFVSGKDLRAAQAALRDRGKGPEIDEVRLERLDEGLCVQMLHVGPYREEGETVAAMKAFAKERGLTFHGLHHEIYLSDPRRVPEERLRTILRQPVR